MWNNQNDFTFSSKADCTRGHYGSGGRWFDTCSFQSVCDWPDIESQLVLFMFLIGMIT